MKKADWDESVPPAHDPTGSSQPGVKLRDSRQGTPAQPTPASPSSERHGRAGMPWRPQNRLCAKVVPRRTWLPAWRRAALTAGPTVCYAQQHPQDALAVFELNAWSHPQVSECPGQPGGWVSVRWRHGNAQAAVEPAIALAPVDQSLPSAASHGSYPRKKSSLRTWSGSIHQVSSS